MQKLTEEFTQRGGEWKEYKVGDLFEIQTPKKKFNANAVTFGTKHPYVVRTAFNNGIRAALDENEEYLNEGNTISFGQDTATIFYQEKPYFTGDKIKVLKFKHYKLNTRIACYLLSVMRKAFSKFSWGNSSFNENILRTVSVELPSINGKIDFKFMEACTRELEYERVRELEAYLKVCGLGSYTLTKNEENAVKTLNRGGKMA